MNPSMRPIAWACRALCAGLVSMPWLTALAQDSTQRVEITGSSIKRTDAETALPVQVITREEIAATGVVNVEQLLQTVSATDQLGRPPSTRRRRAPPPAACRASRCAG